MIKKHILNILLGISIIGFLISSTQYIGEYEEIKETTEAIEEVQEKVDILLNEPVEENQESKGVDILLRYQSLYEVNNDMIGFIYLDDEHRFPVLQNKDNQNYYLEHDFFKEENKAGSIFVNSECRLGEAGITLIYGHHLKHGKMFGCLDIYRKEADYEPIQLDTLYENNVYEIQAVALCNLKDEFKYYDYVGVLSQGEFELWRYFMQDKLLWGSLEGLSYQDTIVELSTCSYEKENNRLVCIFKKCEY